MKIKLSLIALFLAVGLLTAADPEKAAAPKRESGYLGVIVKPLNNDLFRTQMKIPKNTGLVVLFVKPESPAADAGIQVNDVVLTLDKQTLVNDDQFGNLIRMKSPGDVIQLTVIQSGARKTVKATLGKRPEQPKPVERVEVVSPKLGDLKAHSIVLEQSTVSSQFDLKAINDIYNDPKLSNTEKNKRINERLTNEYFPNVKIEIKGKGIGIVSEARPQTGDLKEYLKSLPKEMRAHIEKMIEEGKAKSSHGFSIKIIESGKAPIILQESTQPKKPPVKKKK